MNLYNANQNTYISNNDMPAVARLNIIFWYMYFFMFIPLLLLDVPVIPIVCINVDIPPNALAVNINAALTEALISLEAIRYMPLVTSNREHIIILI